MKMLVIFDNKLLAIIGTAIICISGSILVWILFSTDTQEIITDTVERGDVTEVVSVSGFVEAKNEAALSFPTTGTITEVFVEKGHLVEQGEVLATLASTQLVAQRNEAVAALASATASYDELLAGPSTQARAVTQQSLQNAEQNLTRITFQENEKVANARAAMLSSNLIALSSDGDEKATAPTITGSYTCSEEGVYEISVYKSNALSGYAYRLTGLETDTATAYTNQQSTLGTCGVYIQFKEGESYSNSHWTVSIPNTQAANYIANRNTYDLALQTRSNAIQAAEDALALAQREANLANANPRNEQERQADASIAQARARIETIDAQISDRSIVSPFAGVVTDVNIQAGEIAFTNFAAITVLAQDAFELIVRIPEIDITKIQHGQEAEVVFDASSDEVLQGEVSYVAPIATEIDGVAYFEATIMLTENPIWLRAGLNADVQIITNSYTDVLRIPKRFLISKNDGSFIVYTQGKKSAEATPVNVLFIGNNGYVAIAGLQEGAILTVPNTP